MSASILSKYQEKEEQLKRLKKELELMQSDERLQQEVEFKEKLEALMQEFGKSAKDVLDILNPSPAGSGGKNAASSGTRRKRKLKIYKHPNTGEVIETRGGNHKTLKTWKDEHGAETVESWLVRTED